MKLSRGTAAFIAGSALAASIAGSAVTFTPPAFAASAHSAPLMENVTDSPPLTHPVIVAARTMAVRATATAFNDGFRDAPAWLRIVPVSQHEARDACGLWPQHGMGQGKRGQVVPGVEVFTVNRHGVPVGDGDVHCQSDRIARP